MSDDFVIPPGEHWGRRLTAGQTLSIVDLEGRQAVDFLCYSAARPQEERYSAADTMKIAGSIFLSKGVALYSGLGRKMFTVVDDTVGFHDTIGGCCSEESNFVRYGVRGTPNCRDNFLKALAPFGLGLRDIVANVNWFMYVPVETDGRMAIVQGRSKPGDRVDLRAEMDVVAVISNCPQTRNPANDFKPTPIRAVLSG